MFATLIQVAAGGALGASARYLAGAGATRLFGAGFPWGTLVVNVAGSFLMGILIVTLAERGGLRFAPFLLVGVLGGFTTFSAFSLDAVTLFERGQIGAGAGYIAASVIVSIAALILGLCIARGLA